MSPYLFSADLAATELGMRARATTTVAEATVLSISDLFAAFADARAARDHTRMDLIRQAAALDPGLLAELDGFDDYPAAA